MKQTTYYSVMKKDELAIPWTDNAQQVLDLIKQDKDALLLSMTGKENQKTREWVEHGMIETFEQQTLDQLVADQTSKNIYLGHAFSIMDDLDSRDNSGNVSYVGALYLAAALGQKMVLPGKMIWLLDIALAHGVGFTGEIKPSDFGILDWNQDDDEFVKTLVKEPMSAPKFTRNPLTIIFTPAVNNYYFLVARAFQDVLELLKLNQGGFDFSNLQNPHSYELIHMTYELARFYPRH